MAYQGLVIVLLIHRTVFVVCEEAVRLQRGGFRVCHISVGWRGKDFLLGLDMGYVSASMCSPALGLNEISCGNKYVNPGWNTCRASGTAHVLPSFLQSHRVCGG